MSTSPSLPVSVSRPLRLLAVACLAVLATSLVAMLIDPRRLMGASVWLKPAKFAASIATISVTLVLLMRHLRVPPTGARRAVATIAIMGALEQVVITLQAARGVPSHFNATSAFNTALFTTMGIGITVMTIAVGYIGWFAFRQRFDDRALGWGIRLGFAALLAGSVVGAVMPRPTPVQVESLRAGRPTPLVGAHAVGVPDGGPGLPITRWSTEGGDLRVPHFIGIHGLQLLPLLGWWLGRRGRRTVGTARAARLSAIAGAGYLGILATTLVQALRGRPLLAPDPSTIALAAGVMVGCAIAALWPTGVGGTRLARIAPALAGASRAGEVTR